MTQSTTGSGGSTEPGTGEVGLLRALGAWGLAASIVNITIGGGIFRAPGAMEVTGRLGAAAPLAYLACAVAMGLVVLCIAEAGRRVASTGGPYAYVELAFGGFAGFGIGWLVWITGTIATAAVATIFADAMRGMIPSIGPGFGRAALIIGMFALVAGINVRGVRFGAGLNMGSTIVKLLPLALLIVLGVTRIEPANLTWTSTPTVADVSRASVFVLFIFAGIESALVPSGEVRDPGRTVPRAVLSALSLVTVVYLLIQVTAQGVLGPRLAGNPAPLADLATSLMGPAGGVMLGVAVVLSTFGYLCGMVLAIPRALFAFARDGLLPARLARVHPRFRTPWVAIIAQAVVAASLAISSGFEPLVILANVSVLIVYLGCAAAAWRLRWSDALTAGAGWARLTWVSLVPFLATVVIVGLLTSITLKEWLVVGSVAAVGLLRYAWKHSRGFGRAPA